MQIASIKNYYLYICLLPAILFTLAGCSGDFQFLKSPSPTLTASRTATSTLTYSQTPSPSPAPSATSTTTQTLTPTITRTPTITPTSTITPTPTFDFPDVTVLMQANCRYGPGTAYLYSHGLYNGDHGEVNGRNYSGTWLWIKPDNLDRHCWVAASVVELQGDVRTVAVVQSRLPHATLYEPPGNVRASRDGDRVVVTWDPVWMTDDDYRGYLIEATICQNGNLVLVAVHSDKPSYEFTDELSCSGESGGKLYTVEKHGYTDPVTIPWP